MNKDNAKDYLPLVKALSEGLLEFKAGSGEWVRATEHNISLSGPPSDYRIVKPEPEKWMACGVAYDGWTCQRKFGHEGHCSRISDDTQPTTPTCVHCGKDPNVKSREELDRQAFSDWVYKSGHNTAISYMIKSCLAGAEYARKEGLK